MRCENRAFDAFFRLFEKNLPEFGHNHRKAFDATNDYFEETADFKMFRSYEAFKNAKSRFFKRKKGQVSK